MQFRPLSSFAPPLMAAPALAGPAVAAPVAAAPAAPALRPLAAAADGSATPVPPAAVIPPPAAPAPPAAGQPTIASNLQGISENLLTHIPGEATGFYVLAVSSVDNPTSATLGIIFVCALILLVVARWIAKASWMLMLTTVIAFLLWMQIYDKGFLHVLTPNLMPNPLGLILAGFYSALIALLASAGKIK